MPLPTAVRSLIYRGLCASRQRAATVRRSHACAIFKYDRIGDFILALGAIRLLTQHYGEERCVLIVSTLVEPMARWLFPRADTLALPLTTGGIKNLIPVYLKYRRALTALRASTLVCLRHERSIDDELLMSIPNFDRSFATTNGLPFISPVERAFFPSPFSTIVQYPSASPAGSCLEIEAHRRVVSAVLDRAVEAETIVPTMDAPEVGERAALLFCPFSSAPVKDYSIEGWLEVFAALSWRGPIRLNGAPIDQARLEYMQESLIAAGREKTTIAQTASLDELCAEVGAARAVLGVDSAPAHFTTAMDRPGVFLLGGGHYGMFAPWRRSPSQIWLTHELPCFQCNWHCCHETNRCISEISPTHIAAELDRALAPSPSRVNL